MSKGIKETKEVVEFFVRVLNWLSNSFEDGSMGFRDMLAIAPCLVSVRDAIDNIGDIPNELKDLSEAEKKEIVSFIRKELDLVDDEKESIVEFATQLVFELIRFYSWARGNKK